MNFSKYVLSVILLFLFVYPVFAQNGQISGRVFDQRNNDPLPFANVIVKGSQVGATTDLDG